MTAHRNYYLETTIVELSTDEQGQPNYVLGLGDAVFDGWAAGVSLTLNTNNWISNEFSYMRQQTKFDLIELTITATADPTEGPPDTTDVRIVGLVTRRAAYNTVLNFRPRKSRWRRRILFSTGRRSRPRRPPRLPPRPLRSLPPPRHSLPPL